MQINKLIVGVVVAALLMLTAPVFAIGEITPTPTPAPDHETESPPTPTPTVTPLPPPPESDGGSDVDALLDEAVSVFQAGNFEGAIDLLNQVLEQDPSNAEAYAIRGIAYNQLGSISRAIDDFTRAIDLIPYDWTFHVFRAQAYSQQGEVGLALQDADRAIQLNPRYELAYRTRADINRSLRPEQARLDDLMAEGLRAAQAGNVAGALDAFSTVIDEDAGASSYSANAYYNRALVYYTEGRLERALQDYDAGVEIAPDMHDLFLGRGIARRETDDIRGAGEDFIRRIELLEDTTTEGNIAFNEPRTIDMDYGAVYRFTFSGLGGESITVSARAAENMVVDPLIAILDESGTPIAGDDDFGGGLDSLIENFRLPADGTYTLVVSHANGGYIGPIVVSLE